MRLLIKQRVFSWSDTYDVYDEEGNVRYFVRAEVFALGHQIHVYDAAHVEVGMILEAYQYTTHIIHSALLSLILCNYLSSSNIFSSISRSFAIASLLIFS